MEYNKIYEKLIERAQLRETPNEYCEKHHIVPRCFYGSDDKRNLVLLTAREHFIAHRLLAKMRPWHNGLLHAVASFMTNSHINSRQFEIARKQQSQAASKSQIGNTNSLGYKHTPETKLKMKEAAIRRESRVGTARDETKSKISAALKGRILTEEHKAKIGAANKGNKLPLRDDLYREKMSAIMKGKSVGKRQPQSEAHRAAISSALKGKPRKSKKDVVI